MNAEPSNFRPLSPYHRPPRTHPIKPHPLIPVLYSPTTAPLACTFTRQPTHKPPHICALSPLLLRTFFPNFYGETATPLRIFTHHPRTYHIISQHQRAHRSAPSPMLLRTFSPNFYGETAPPQRTFTLISTHLRALFYRGCGAVLPYNQIVDPMSFERLYGGIGEKSIEYPRKVYRVFPESL